MPLVSKTVVGSASLISKSPPKHTFDFPNNQHLLITTPSLIFAWDKAGFHILFSSSKSGIIAAREAKDGSGVIAVADKHVVVLHDTKRRQEKSWGLSGDEDQVRLLEYTADAESLFLATSLTGAIQCYSPKRAGLIDPVQSHASPPTVLAVSPTAHLLLSASAEPPVVYLKNLTLKSEPTLVQPRASNAPVSVAAFHPERANVFLLAFKDGTLAIYDATRLARRRIRSFTGSYSEEAEGDGEIGHFSELHRTTSKTNRTAPIGGGIVETGSKSVSITGAAFLPGYMVRVISVGSDGRCRLVDFGGEPKLLRTWHAQAPLTSVSVLAVKSQPSKRGSMAVPPTSTSKRASKANTIGGPMATESIIAVGRADGKVLLFDSIGLLLARKRLGDSGERIIGVDWVSGPAPRALAGRRIAVGEGSSDLPSLSGRAPRWTPASKLKALPKSTRKNAAGRASMQHQSSAPKRLVLPPASKPTTPTPALRRFTIHPEEELNTVRHTPSPERDPPQRSIQLPRAAEYLDLFSPLRASSPPQRAALHVPGLTTPRLPSRPRISRDTFVQETASRQFAKLNMSPLRKTDLFSGSSPTSSVTQSSMTLRTRVYPPSTSRKLGVKSMDQIRTSGDAHIGRSRKRVSFKRAEPSFASVGSSYSYNGAGAQPDANGQILADLRKMSEAGPMKRKGSKLSVFAPYLRRAKTTTWAKPHGEKAATIEPDVDRQMARKKSSYTQEREDEWPEDSAYNSAASDEADDIWLTSGSEDDPNLDPGRRVHRKRSVRHQDRPPARQTSRSRVDSSANTLQSTFSESSPQRYSQPTTQPAVLDQPEAPVHAILSQANSEEWFTAPSQLPREFSWSPRSQDIRDLIPRTSSLSPFTRKSIPHGARQREVARDLKLNAALGRQQRSPWVRARGGVNGKALGKQSLREDPAPPVNAAEVERAVQSSNTQRRTRDRVQQLEDEVARLKGEVLVLKAAMRRAGVFVPSS